MNSLWLRDYVLLVTNVVDNKIYDVAMMLNTWSTIETNLANSNHVNKISFHHTFIIHPFH